VGALFNYAPPKDENVIKCVESATFFRGRQPYIFLCVTIVPLGEKFKELLRSILKVT
jgi:hypothetical protein